MDFGEICPFMRGEETDIFDNNAIVSTEHLLAVYYTKSCMYRMSAGVYAVKLHALEHDPLCPIETRIKARVLKLRERIRRRRNGFLSRAQPCLDNL